MADIPKTPETAPIPTPDATPGTPTEAVPAAPAAAGTPAAQPGPSVADTVRLLAERFPALFGAGVIKPIKLRIQADIHERAPGVFSKKALSLFLQRHTTATAYLRALVAEGATRTDLDGQPAGEIAAEHRDAAGAELERRRAIVEAKKQAAREAARASRQAARQDARPEQPATSSRPDRAPRPPRPEPGQRRARPPQAGAPRGPGRPGTSRSEAPRRRHERLPDRDLPQAHEPEASRASTPPLTPEQAAEAEARRQRALLLRSFEQSPLSKANFGALKGLSEAALDALLAQARQERGSR